VDLTLYKWLTTWTPSQRKDLLGPSQKTTIPQAKLAEKEAASLGPMSLLAIQRHLKCLRFKLWLLMSNIYPGERCV